MFLNDIRTNRCVSMFDPTLNKSMNYNTTYPYTYVIFTTWRANGNQPTVQLDDVKYVVVLIL